MRQRFTLNGSQLLLLARPPLKFFLCPLKFHFSVSALSLIVGVTLQILHVFNLSAQLLPQALRLGNFRPGFI